jgi:hypothetical protein
MDKQKWHAGAGACPVHRHGGTLSLNQSARYFYARMRDIPHTTFVSTNSSRLEHFIMKRTPLSWAGAAYCIRYDKFVVESLINLLRKEGARSFVGFGGGWRMDRRP